MTAIVGWQRVRAGRYQHDTGAQVFRVSNDAGEWAIKRPDGITSAGYGSMQEAMQHVQQQQRQTACVRYLAANKR